MGPLKVNQNLGYGICLNSCDCEVFNKRHTTVIKKGCLAKFQYRELDQNRSILTLITNKSELYVREFLSYNLIDHKLFKYLNAINDFEERLKFYKNGERREFVLYLEKNSVVSVGFSSGKQTKAVFHEIYENEKKIFITVELLVRPFKYSLPANMVHKIGSLDSSHNSNRLFFHCLPIYTPSFDYSALAYWRCYDNVQNGNTSNVSRGKSVSKSVQPVKKKIISQNSGKLAFHNEAKNIFGPDNSKTNVVSNISTVTSLFNHKPIKSSVCLECSNVCESNICRNCDSEVKNIVGQNNSKTNVVLKISAITILSSLTTTKSRVCPECSNKCEGNICRTCELKNIFGHNNSQSKFDSNISLDTSLFTHKLINLQTNKLCGLCSNVCEDNICLSCVNETQNMFGQNNSKINLDSNISSDTSLSTDIPTNWDVCVECLRAAYVNEGNICLSCDLKKISGQNNFQTKIGSIISLEKSLFSETPINSLEINTIECVGSVPRRTRNYDCSTLEYWRCNENIQNGTTNNVSGGKSVSRDVEPVKKKIISQNLGGSGLQENYHEQSRNKTIGRSYNNAWNDESQEYFTSSKIVGRNVKLDESPCETRDSSALIVPSSSSADILINARLCIVCLIIVSDDDICRSCTNKMKRIYGDNNSQTKIVSNISLNSSLSSETPINLTELNKHVTNDFPDTSKIAVNRNISASNCISCKKHLDVSEGFFLILCKHTFCETCIKNQITLKIIDHTKMLPCCDRPIGLNEINYFLYNHEHKQFKASEVQKCFDKNCTGYYLWEECGEKRPVTFTCNKCELDNCLECETIHVNLACEQYDKIRNSVDKETVELFLTWIREGIAMPCPKCETLIEKDEGGDWVQCNFCNTEICWATRGPRWGPNGNGDTSGGCKCDFKVKKCVDNCNFCG